MADPEMDKELAKSLTVAKKKPRNFAIIAKGLNVLRLIIDKKPIKDGAVQAAKKECQGNAVTRGVVVGDGAELVFKVVEETKVNPLKLREFIDASSGLKVKARIEVVATLEEVNDEAPDDAPESGTGDVSAAPPVSPPSGDAIQFTQRLKTLKPALDPLLAANVPASQTAKVLLGEAAALARKSDFTAALERLDQLESLLKQARTAQAETSSASGADATKEFTARLKALMPAIAAAAGTPAGDAAKRKANEAGLCARRHEYGPANLLLDDVVSLLKGDATPEQPAGEGEKGPSGDVAAVWRDAKDETDSQFNKLTAKLRQSQHPYLRRVAELGLQGLASDPGRVFVSMQAAIFDYRGATGEARRKAGAKLLDAVKNYRTFVEGNRLLEVLDTDGHCGPLTIRKTLLDALGTMDRIVTGEIG